MELQKELDNEKLVDNRRRLNKFTNEKLKKQKQFEKEIIMADNKKLDDIHMKYIQVNEDKLSFDDLRLIRSIFEFIKTN